MTETSTSEPNCNYCSTYTGTRDRWLESREAYEDRLAEMDERGVDQDGPEWAAFEAVHAEILEDLDETDVEEFTSYMLENGLFSNIRMLEFVTSDMHKTITWASSDEFVNEFCPRVLRPTHRFLKKNGFRSVVRTDLLKCIESASSCDRDISDEIKAVELVGGISSSGFFVGVISLQRYT